MVTPDNSFKDLPLPASHSVVEVLEPTGQNRSGLLEMEEHPVRCYAQALRVTAAISHPFYIILWHI